MARRISAGAWLASLPVLAAWLAWCATPLALAAGGAESARPSLAASAPSVARQGQLTGLDTARQRADGALVIRDTLAGQGSITEPGTRVILGKVSPGHSPGCVTDQGNVVFEGSASLEIELGGAAPCTGYDQYSVALSLRLNSPNLKVLLINGFQPSVGQRFDILNWGSLTGSFGSIELPPLPSGLSWSLGSLYTTGELVVVLTPTGDVPLPAWALGLLAVVLLGPLMQRRAG